ncbi:hypothetical protein D3C81_1585280 [compost metagenome]
MISRCSLIGSSLRSARRDLLASRPSIRSESRTEETSGLVTTIASSAKYMARWAPFSIPAGESQTTYSKVFASSSMTLPTPSRVRASLSRVWLAAST